MYDVIIAGAGPAGSTAAYFLARAGIKCLLIDKATFPRQKPCGGGLSGRTLSLFPHIQPLVECTNFETILHFKKPQEDMRRLDEKGMVFFIRRVTFDNDLLNLAKKENVDVKEGTRVVKIEQHPDHVTLDCTQGIQFDAKFLIGADGVHSIVRKSTELQQYWHGENNVLAFENEVELPSEIIDQFYTNKRSSHLHFGFGKLYGYGWIFAKKNHVNIGFGEGLNKMTPGQILHCYEAYIKYCQGNHLLPEFSSPLSHPLAWQLYSNGPIKRFCTGRVLLAGDAAGFVHPVSGEGILYALWSGTIAAECIGKVLHNQLSLADLPHEYEGRCMREFGNELLKAKVFHKVGKKGMGIVFQLARFDPIITDLLAKFFNGLVKFDPFKRKLLWRSFIGVMKGHLWKK